MDNNGKTKKTCVSDIYSRFYMSNGKNLEGKTLWNKTTICQTKTKY